MARTILLAELIKAYVRKIQLVNGSIVFNVHDGRVQNGRLAPRFEIPVSTDPPTAPDQGETTNEVEIMNDNVGNNIGPVPRKLTKAIQEATGAFGGVHVEVESREMTECTSWSYHIRKRKKRR